MKKIKIALAHDYLREYGGAERVLEALHEIYPDAPVYVAFVDRAALGLHWQKFADWELRQSWITRIPFYKKLYSPLRVLAPSFFSSFDLSEFNLVISSANMYFAKAVKTRPGALHITYCHTPPRSLYGYTTMTDWQKNIVVKWGGQLINHYLRVIDYRVSQRVDKIIVNSAEVQRRVEKFYRRDSQIIYPPVNIPEIKPASDFPTYGYYLYVGRLAKSKNVDLAIQASNQLQLPLKIVGAGGGLDYLQHLAGPTVEFLGAIDDQQLTQLYQGARALIFPAEDEDFGIVPVEAMGYGLPVIAHNSGGPRETIVDGETGVFFPDLTVASLSAALKKSLKIKWSRAKIYRHAQKFSKQRFQQQITELVAQTMASRP